MSIEEIGIKIGQVYHLHNIGNNNEYRLYIEDKDSEGFVVEKNIAKLHITYGVYGGVSIWVENYITEQEMCGLHYAR